MTDDNIIQFPDRTNVTELEKWFFSIEDRVGDTELEDGIVILTKTDGQMKVYVMNDMRKDQFAGILQIAMMKGLYDAVAE